MWVRDVSVNAAIKVGSLAYIARILDGAVGVGKRDLRIAERPPGQRLIERERHPDVLPKSCGQRPVLDRVIERHRLIDVPKRFFNIARVQQGNTHVSVPNHQRHRRPLFLRKSEEVRGKLAHHVPSERDEAGNPKSVQKRKEQQWILWRLANGFRLFNQEAGLLRRSFGFRRRMALDVDERGKDRDLKLDLFAAQGGRAWQGGDLIECACDLFDGFQQRRTVERSLACLAPQRRGLFNESGLRAMTRQQLRLALDKVSKFALEGLGNPGVKRTPRLAKQRAMGRVLHQSMLEQIGRGRRRALAEQQACRNETVERFIELRFRLAHYRSQQRVGKPPPDCGANLRHLLRRAKSVEPRQERRVQARRHLKRREWNCRQEVCSVAPWLSASSTALVISSTKSGMPSVRSMMS